VKGAGRKLQQLLWQCTAPFLGCWQQIQRAPCLPAGKHCSEGAAACITSSTSLPAATLAPTALVAHRCHCPMVARAFFACSCHCTAWTGSGSSDAVM
jgi:hypothetical protein